MEDAPKKRRGRLMAGVAAGVAAVAIAVPVSGAFADSSSQSATPQSQSSQQAPGLEGVQSQSQGGSDAQRSGKDCPRGQQGGGAQGGGAQQGSGSDSSSTAPSTGGSADASLS